jgi:hypothetical protein
MYVDKAEIVAALRARGLEDRADWFDRQLPDMVDISKNGSLLDMLGIDPASMHVVEAAGAEGTAPPPT